MRKGDGKQYRRDEDGYPVQRVASEAFQIRHAAARDADVIAWHRARMFQDMGDVSGDAFEILRAKARTRLEQWIHNGNYIGWLATPADKPEIVIAGAGVQLQPILPAATRCIDDRRRPAGNHCERLYRTAMATARHSGSAH
jgi:hypothetical protein